MVAPQSVISPPAYSRNHAMGHSIVSAAQAASYKASAAQDQATYPSQDNPGPPPQANRTPKDKWEIPQLLNAI
jgi:hypothetical protein